MGIKTAVPPARLNRIIQSQVDRVIFCDIIGTLLLGSDLYLISLIKANSELPRSRDKASKKVIDPAVLICGIAR